MAANHELPALKLESSREQPKKAQQLNFTRPRIITEAFAWWSKHDESHRDANAPALPASGAKKDKRVTPKFCSIPRCLERSTEICRLAGRLRLRDSNLFPKSSRVISTERWNLRHTIFPSQPDSARRPSTTSKQSAFYVCIAIAFRIVFWDL